VVMNWMPITFIKSDNEGVYTLGTTMDIVDTVLLAYFFRISLFALGLWLKAAISAKVLE